MKHVVILALLTLALPALAEDGTEAAAMEAAALEARVQSAPHDAKAQLAYGIGQAQAGNLGASIVAFERARLAAPRDRDVEDALLVAHRESRRRQAETAGAGGFVAGEPAEIGRWRFFTRFRMSTFAWLTLLSAWCAVGAAFAAQRRETGRDALWVTATLATFIALGSAFMWRGAHQVRSTIAPAVVVDATPRWREAPDRLARPTSDVGLYEGAVVAAIEIRASWVHVRTADGSSGWIAADEVALVAPTSRR